MGQTRAERTWPAPRGTRFVWVRGGRGHAGPARHPLEPPTPGLVLAWRRRSYVWEALVVTAAEGEEPPDGDAVVVQRWIPAADLRPVPADPNRAFGAR
ncbi:hypothetical protein [Calidifontibacter terrae]